MRKNTKAILVLLCALVMVLTGIGMPVARAEQLDSLTVDSIFDGLGAALQYGTVAREWDQNAHAETNACVDVMDRYTNTIFSNTGSTYFHAMGYELQAEVSAPETLKGMTFGLFKEGAAGTDYVLCAGTEITVTDDTTATTLTWDIGDKNDASVSELKNTRLFVMQVENGTYVKDGTKNEAELIVTYGPSVSASAYNTNYIGKMFYRTPLGEGDSVGIFNTTEYSPGIEFGPETRLYQKVEKRDENNQLYYEYVVIDPNDKDLDVQNVLVNYYYGDMDNPTVGYAKLDGISFKDGVFSKSGNVIEITYKEEKGYATSLVNNAKEYSAYLGNLGGGEITSLIPNPNGGSTVTGPVDAKGNVVSVYDAEVGADGVFQVKADMGWDGIPVAENEYVIINVICPSKDGKVTMGTSAGDITYFYKEGQSSGEGVAWGGVDSNSSQRVIFNFVYADENGIMQPYAGTVEPTARHGGTLLAPSATVVLNKEVHNGSIIADTVNNGQEIHQRSFAAQARSTWVRMDCGTLWLQKASMGYNWNAGQYGQWEDMSDKVNLAGAVFGVYSNENCTEDSLVVTMTTDEEGKATSELLSAGTYWVKEITPLKDHNLSDKVVEVKVVAGVPTQVMGGGYFVENGGHYEYPMFRPPVWVPDYDEVVAEEKFVNQQNNGYTSLRLVKNDEFGNVLQGAEFTIYRTRRYNGWTGTYEYSNELAKAKTNRNGVVLFENVPLSYEPVTYYIMETAAPEGYKKSERVVEVTLDQDDRDKIVTIDGNGNAAGEAFINEIIRGNMALKKVNAADSKIVLEGAEFTIYSDKACTKIVGVMTTGKNGIATSKGIDNGKDLIPGTYYVKETKAPDGYKQQLDSSVYPPVPVVYTVDVKYGKMVDVVTNKEIADADRATGIGNDQYIHISGEKRWYDAEFDAQRPQQVTIELYRKKADGSNEWIAETKTSAPEWKFDFEHVELPRYDANGKEIEYIIRENLNGNQYYYAFVKQTEDKNGNITAIVSNSVKTTKVVGSKKWEDNLDSEHPEKITFLLFVDVDGELTQVRSPYDSNSMYTADGMRHENYKFTFENLPTYDVNGDPAKYVVKEADSDNYHVVKSVSESETEGNQTTVTITLTNRLTVPLKGTKTWLDSSNADGLRPENIDLEVFDKNNKKVDMGPESGITVEWDKTTDPDVWQWSILGLHKYDADGNLNTYTVKEKLKPGSGYKQEVSEDGLHFTNIKTGVLRLFKGHWDLADKEIIDSKFVAIDGAEFGVYYDEACQQLVCKETTKSDRKHKGYFEVKDLAPGIYYVKELNAAPGYELDETVLAVEVVAGSTDSRVLWTDKVNDVEYRVVYNEKEGTSVSAALDLTKKLVVTGDAAVGETFDFTMSFVGAKDASGAEKTTGCMINDFEESIAFTAAGDKTATDAFKVTFVEAGTYTFEVKETVETKVDNVIYDDTVYTVTYTVTESEGQLTAAASINKGEAAADKVEFVNTYKVEEKTSINVLKHWPTSKGIDVSKYLFLCTLDADGKPDKLDPQPQVKYTTVQLPEDVEHHYTWSDLPKCDDKGNEIKYVVIEEGLEGYFTSYDNGSGGSDSYAGNGGVIVNRIARDFFRISKDVDNYNGAELPTDIAFNFTITPGEKNPGDCELRQVDWEAETETKLTPDETGVYTVSLAANEGSDFGVYFPVVAGTYTFVVQEVVPSPLPDNWAYDTHTYTVTFEVADDGSVEMSQSGEGDDVFTNKYYGTTELEITKYWEFDTAAMRPVKPETFAQYLTLRYAEYPLDTEGDPVYDHEFSANEWKEYTATPSVVEDDEYENEWVITYENLPNCIGGKEVTWSVVEKDIPGYTKDYDHTGEEDEGEQWAEHMITNTLELTSVSVTKEWVGGRQAELNIAEYLTLYADGDKVDLSPACNGNVYTWNELPKYENGKLIAYTVKETTVPDGYTVTYLNEVGEDAGELVPGDFAQDGGKIVNTYAAKGSIVLEGTKVLEGRTLAAGEFSFELKDANGNVLQTKKNAQNGSIVFDAIEYTEADLSKSPIKYTISEVKGSESGMTYAANVAEVIVTLTDNGDGTIDAKADKTKEEIEFVNTYEEKVYEAKGSIVLEGTKILEGRTLKADEFSFELKDANGNVLQTKKNAQDGSIVFDKIEYTEADLSKSPIKYTISEVKGSESGMTYAANVAEVTVTLTDNGDGTIKAEADKTKAEIVFTNTYEEKVYEAKGNIVLEGTKVLEGRTLKDGEFTFEVKDASDKVIATGANDAAGKIVFSEIKYTEKDAGKTYTYKVYEVKGDLPGVTYVEEPVTVKVTVTDNGDGTLTAALTKDSPAISFKNTYEAEGAVTFKGAKFLLGREFKQGDEFTFELLNEKGDVIDTVTINPTGGTKADFAFKTIKYELADAGKTYTYTYRVKEKAGTEDGMTYDDTVHTVTVTVSDAGDGSLKVVASDSANKLNFTNTYLAEGSVLFSGTKTMNGKALVGKDFTFVLTDADGKEIETVTNDKDGKIVFSTIQYDLEDVGKTFTYKVSEKNDGKKAVTYDDTVYTVTVKVEDAGAGHLKVTASDNAAKLNFTNSYEAKAYLTLNAFKTVNGYKPTADQVYDFVLLCDDGTEMTAQNKDENIIFGTLTFNEDDIGKTFIYTVKETTEANELLEVDTAIYQVAVTVVDNGDGNLKLETEFLKDGKRASGVVFANTATATLAISKTVKGPGPDKAFDLKVTFIGVDGKELEGVYDYDGDVKGTITSGGVIALKDGQSVTIVGLPEGATYTVEENAGPAYTVTVNGKPIAKAEGTLVGHGKLEFINTVEVTTFSVTKVWEGTDLGEITLTLYADGKQITPQPEVTREGDKYTYYELPKYNEEGEEIVYSAKERGIDGYIRIYNNVEPYQDVTSVIHDGGTIINREIQEEVHELSFKIRKVWTGVEATEEIPAITLTLYCNGEKLDVPTPKPNSEGWYKYYDLPKTVNGQIAVYTVVEEPIPGYTVTYKTASGEIVEEGVNGGEIINAKIPQTGDPATLGLWLALMGASAVLLTMLQRRRKA